MNTQNLTASVTREVKNCTNLFWIAKLLDCSETEAFIFYRRVIKICLWKLDLGSFGDGQNDLSEGRASTLKVLCTHNVLDALGKVGLHEKTSELLDISVAKFLIETNLLVSLSVSEVGQALHKKGLEVEELKSADKIRSEAINSLQQEIAGLRQRLDLVSKELEAHNPDPFRDDPILTNHDTEVSSGQTQFISLRNVQLYERLQYWSGIYEACVESINDKHPEFNFSAFQQQAERGTLPLIEENLVPYIASYGGHHYHKLRAAFIRTHFADLQGKKIEIVDWGCGQAVATCVLLDWLLENNILINLSRITLIEPSLHSLEAGIKYVQRILLGVPEVTTFVRTANVYLNDLTDEQVETNTGDTKIHLFSNILDVDGINLADLSARIMRCSHGQNRFICSSPRYNNRETRLDQFKAFFAARCSLTNSRSVDDNLYGEIFSFIRRQYARDRITRCERQFTATF